ncbi:hypothetical protein VM1G_11935 [Cytospora mali]|uniref:Uncharacterized protein n=1 Tax=Cytospora mali TaxID=578113 RepID=A0A194WBJ1_CYTMA|nr:hypothetical protein VM1G_11935 [Valsa mali]
MKQNPPGRSQIALTKWTAVMYRFKDVIEAKNPGGPPGGPPGGDTLEISQFCVSDPCGED